MYVLTTGEQLDFLPLDAFLQERGIGRWRREVLIQDVWNAYCRYAASQDQERVRLKKQLARVFAASRKLDRELKALNFGSSGYAHFEYAIHQTMPPNIPEELQSERVRALRNLLTNVEKVSRGTDDALKELKKSWRHPKMAFGYDLATAWKNHTGKVPGSSGSVTWDKPTTRFAQFAKVVACTVPTAGEFKNGFADWVRRACG